VLALLFGAPFPSSARGESAMDSLLWERYLARGCK
jgi:hypothetical protein